MYNNTITITDKNLMWKLQKPGLKMGAPEMAELIAEIINSAKSTASQYQALRNRPIFNVSLITKNISSEWLMFCYLIQTKNLFGAAVDYVGVLSLGKKKSDDSTFTLVPLNDVIGSLMRYQTSNEEMLNNDASLELEKILVVTAVTYFTDLVMVGQQAGIVMILRQMMENFSLITGVGEG